MRLADSLAVIFTGLLAFFEIRHLTHGGNALAHGSSFLEQGLMTFVSLGLAAAMLKLDLGRRQSGVPGGVLRLRHYLGAFRLGRIGHRPKPLLRIGSDRRRLAYQRPHPGLSLAVAYGALSGAGLAWDPAAMVHGWGRGALLLARLPVRDAKCAPPVPRRRHQFQGLGTTDAEQWAYSVLWLALGLLFLAYGIWRSSPEARLASGALVLLSTLKVFLFDLAGVAGLWRALSFICLGLVLIGIGLSTSASCSPGRVRVSPK